MGRRIRGVSFAVRGGEVLAVLGPSGAGKTSLLRAIAGLEAASGELHFGELDLLGLRAEQRRIALVFQEGALFPHMTIRQNLRFGMRVPDDARIAALAFALEIDEHLDVRPGQISGGERQRAAIARAVLSDPRAILLDEPFAHLDPALRVRVREVFKDFAHSWGGPVIFVTHDHEEALTLGTQVAILMHGSFVQTGTPAEVYARPKTIDVVRFLAMPPVNLLDEGRNVIAVRAEDVRVDEAAPLRGTITSTSYVGASTFLRVRTPRGDLTVRVAGEGSYGAGQTVGVAFNESRVLRYEKESGVLLE